MTVTLRPFADGDGDAATGSIAVLIRNGFVEVGRELDGDVEETVFRLGG